MHGAKCSIREGSIFNSSAADNLFTWAKAAILCEATSTELFETSLSLSFAAKILTRLPIEESTAGQLRKSTKVDNDSLSITTESLALAYPAD